MKAWERQLTVTKEQILDKLRSVRGPDLETDIVTLGMVSDIFIADGKNPFKPLPKSMKERFVDAFAISLAHPPWQSL